MSFFVHYNNVHKYTRVHVSECRECNGGDGKQAAVSGANSGWRGPFETREQAVKVALSYRGYELRTCGHCP